MQLQQFATESLKQIWSAESLRG